LVRDLFETARFAAGATHSVFGPHDRSPVARYMASRLRAGLTKALPAKSH
jgi:hypothetical protein